MQNPSLKTTKDDDAGILELMEFTIAGNAFGINVAKVTEIMQRRPVKYMSNSHPCIEGIFKPRGEIVTLIDLPKYMALPGSENPDRDMVMLTNFSNIHAAFHVHTVEAMHRIHWRDVIKPDNTVYGGRESLVTGNTKIGDKLITIVDFEKVIFDINPDTGLHMSEITDMGEQDRGVKSIVIAEDSVFLRKMLMEAMEKAGYTKVRYFENGLEAWTYLQTTRDNSKRDGIPIETNVSAIITDIEMPQMDGHHLTKLVKEDKDLKTIPVIVFSSLIDESQRTKGELLGVSAHLSKPQIGQLVSTLDKLIL